MIGAIQGAFHPGDLHGRPQVAFDKGSDVDGGTPRAPVSGAVHDTRADQRVGGEHAEQSRLQLDEAPHRSVDLARAFGRTGDEADGADERGEQPPADRPPPDGTSGRLVDRLV